MSFWLLFKRTAAKPALLIMMCAALICTLLCGMLTEDDGIPNCGVVSSADENSEIITEWLVKDGLIRYESTDALKKGIECGEVSCGFVFPDDFTERLKDTDTDELIMFYESHSALFPAMYKYRIIAYILDVYAPFLTSDLLLYEGINIPPEKMREIISDYMENDEPFSFTLENAESAPLEVSHYSQNLAMGTLALFLFFAFGLFAIPYTEKQFLPIAKRVGLKKALFSFSLPSILSVILMFMLSSIAALLISDKLFNSGAASLIVAAAVYIIFLSALGIAANAIFGSTEKVRVPIMALCLMSVAFCPIFVDIPALIGLPDWPRFLLPPMFFYAAIDSPAVCAAIAIPAFAVAVALYAARFKKMYLK